MSTALPVFSMAFDRVSLPSVNQKFESNRNGNETTEKINNFLENKTQEVAIEGQKSQTSNVTQ